MNAIVEQDREQALSDYDEAAWVAAAAVLGWHYSQTFGGYINEKYVEDDGYFVATNAQAACWEDDCCDLADAHAVIAKRGV